MQSTASAPELLWVFGITLTKQTCSVKMASCQCVCAAPPMVPLASRQLKPEHLQRLAPQGVLFCIIIKDAYGVWETVMLHVCHAGLKKSWPTLCEEIAMTYRFSVHTFAVFQDIS